MKTGGFLLIQFSALLFALQRVQTRKRRTETLQSFCVMLEQLRGLLEAESAPMPDLLLTLSKRCEGDASVFIKTLYASLGALGALSFQELWKKALRENPVSEDERACRELEALGAVLGRYELSTQLEAAASCLEALRLEAEQKRRELPVKNRLTWGLTFSAAMLLGILLF